jgi:4-amino-4-deoxy-L-arabinose transferase-like glycosyltransferase
MTRRTISYVLLIIFLIQAVQLVLWIKKDDSPPAWDQSWHASISVNAYNQLFGKTHLTTYQIEQIYPIFRYANNYYPHFYHISTIPFYALFGTGYDSALLTNLLFLLIFILSSYFIGKKIHSHEAGLVMAFITSTIPAHSYIMRHYLIDFSLSAMVALGFALLLYTDCFKNLKYSVLFGIITGFGVLTKWTYPLFLIIPISFALFSKNNLMHKKNFRLRNILLSLVSFIFIASTWYHPSRIKTIMPLLNRSVQGFIGGTLQNKPEFYSLSALSHYFFIIINQYSFIYSVIFAIGAATFIFKYKEKKGKKECLFSLLSIFIVYIVCTIVPNKDPRHIMPIYIFLVTVSMIGTYAIKSKKMRYTLIALMVIFGLFQNVSYNAKVINVDYKIGRISLYNSKGMYPRHSKIYIDKVLSAINNSSDGGYFSACIIAESGALNDSNIPYYSLKENYPVGFMVGNGCNPLRFDYTIIGPIHETWRSNLFKNSKSILDNNISKFELLSSPCKDVYVYKRIK